MLRIGLYIRFIIFPKRLAYRNEAKISNYFGWNPWVAPVVVCLVLLVLIWQGSKALAAGWKYNLASICTCFLIVVLLLKIKQVVFY